ncbi:MAG: hypothetical protein EWM47_10060, partial [Anaerolineaceae bacterium]
MLSEERERIISEEYADLIIEYNGDTSLFDQFPDRTVQIINMQYAFVHVPVSFITQDIVFRMGY